MSDAIPHFLPKNVTASYQIRFHFGWYTHGRRPIFADKSVRDVVERSFQRVANDRDYHVLEFDLEPEVLRAIVSLKPAHAPAEVTRIVKGNIATDVRREAGLSNLWSRGWFVRSTGNVSNDVIRHYIANQFAHHRAAPIDAPDAVALARFHDRRDPAQLRKTAHAVFEYNLHVVLVVRRRFDFLDMHVAYALVEYWRAVAAKHGWLAWDIEAVWNHVHLFLGLAPSDAPESVALSLMNNSAYFLEQRYGAALKLEQLDGVWQPGYHVGTAGAATTAQIRAFLSETVSGDAVRSGS
jgi:putative transposase